MAAIHIYAQNKQVVIEKCSFGVQNPFISMVLTLRNFLMDCALSYDESLIHTV